MDSYFIAAVPQLAEVTFSSYRMREERKVTSAQPRQSGAAEKQEART
jgi:hypothetical protein